MHGCVCFMSKIYQFNPRWTDSRREGDWGITTTSRLSGICPVSGKQDSSRVDQRGAMCSPRDVSWNAHKGSRVKGSKWRIMCVKEFSISRWWQRDQYQHGDICHWQQTWMRSWLIHHVNQELHAQMMNAKWELTPVCQLQRCLDYLNFWHHVTPNLPI